MVNMSLKVSFISCAEQQRIVLISNTLSSVIFAACFPLLRVALPEGVLQTPIVYSERWYTSNRNIAQVVLCKCKPRYNIRTKPLSNLDCSSQGLFSLPPPELKEWYPFSSGLLLRAY